MRRAFPLLLPLAALLLPAFAEETAPAAPSASSGGIGVILSVKDDSPGKVLFVFPDGPASTELKEGDVIVQVDGKAAAELDSDHPAKGLGMTLRGAPGTPVELVVAREGKTRTVALHRAALSSFLHLAAPAPPGP